MPRSRSEILDASWRPARVAVAAVFALNGVLSAMWVAHIPVITDRAGVDHAALGLLLLLIGGSAFLGMQLCGPIIDRAGSRWPVVIAAIGLSFSVLGPALSTSAGTLAIGLVLFGFFNGALDVSMNSQAVVIERRYGRPIMSSFHGYFSLGGLVGSGAIALALSLDVSVVVTCAVAAAVGSVLVLAIGRHLVSGRQSPDSHAPQPMTRRVWGRVAVLAVVAFAMMLAEGAAFDWSALHTVQRFDESDAVGAIAFGAFSALMVVGRFSADAVSARYGPVAVVRFGAVLAVIGVVTVIVAPVPALAIGGWAVVGLGLAGAVPQLFTAAGNISTAASGRIISLVVGCGYLGMLAGPASIGFVARAGSLGTALWVAAAAAVVGVLLARAARPTA